MSDISVKDENKLWAPDFESVLESIRINSVIMAKLHKRRYQSLKRSLKYYRIPVIIISAFNSVISVGAQPFIIQKYISAINCLLSLLCGIVGSIEMYFSIDSRMQQEYKVSKDYYILATSIFKTLSLTRENRSIDGKSFLDESFNNYSKLIESSSLAFKAKLKDFLAPLPSEYDKIHTPNGSQSSDEV